MKNLPNDADGDALRRVAEHSDLTKPMYIDFAVVVPSEEAGREVVTLAAQRGYDTSIEHDDETDRWTCYCKRHMLASYEGVRSAQSELDELSAEVGGYSDGWGTLGNTEDKAN